MNEKYSYVDLKKENTCLVNENIFKKSVVWNLLERIVEERKLVGLKHVKTGVSRNELCPPKTEFDELKEILVLKFNEWWNEEWPKSGSFPGPSHVYHWDEIRFKINEEEKVALVYKENGQIKSITDEDEITMAFEDVITKDIQDGEKSKYVLDRAIYD